MEPKKLIVSALLTVSLLTSLVLPIKSSQSNPSGGTGNDINYTAPEPSQNPSTPSWDPEPWIINYHPSVDPQPWVINVHPNVDPQPWV